MSKYCGGNSIRKRDADATKEDILDPARMVFMNKGYDSAGTREIAERAGVNVALISRYFGSKEGLFLQAIPPTLTIDDLLDGPMEEFGARAASHFVYKKHDGEYDPIVALIRTATSKIAVQVLQTALSEQFTLQVVAKLNGDNKLERAALIGSILVGFHFKSRIIGTKPNLETDKPTMEALMAKALQDLVDGS